MDLGLMLFVMIQKNTVSGVLLRMMPILLFLLVPHLKS